MKRFKEKAVIVTGAGSGIGRATAIRFAKEGAKVALVGSNQDALETVAAALPQDHSWIHSDNHLTITCDMAQQTQVATMIAYVLQRFGSIEVLVTADGVYEGIHEDRDSTESLANLSAAQWRSMIDSNINDTVLVCQAVLSELINSKGSIINIASPLPVDSNACQQAYQRAKAEVVSLTQTLAQEYGHRGVRVNSVSTSFFSSSSSGSVNSNANSAINRATATVTQPQMPASLPALGRLATPDDIAAAITFLASDDAAMITGIDLLVDGGLSITNARQ